jgi:membrane protease YdiL (CAAX protease family)
MQPGETSARRDALLVFFALAFVISWCGWIPVLTLGNAGLPFLALVAMSPAVAALVAARRCATALPIVLGPWRSPAWTFAFALLAPVALVAAGTFVATQSDPHRQYELSAGALTLGYFAQCLFANPLEEIGWRGFALPRLSERYGPARASLVVGLAWALWHLPMFVWAASPMRAFPRFAWAASLLAESFLLTWLYFRSRRSVAVVSLFHISVNLAATALGIASFAVNAAVFAVAALVVWRIAPRGLWR